VPAKVEKMAGDIVDLTLDELLDVKQIFGNIDESIMLAHMQKVCVIYCNTLQHTATCPNALQHTSTHCNTLPRTATYCNTLQRAATHYNTLQYTRAG